MMTVLYIKEHTDSHGKRWKRGEIANVPDAVAEQLKAAGIVEFRESPKPTETKAEPPAEQPEKPEDQEKEK
jgi:hypothetical protein